MSDDQNCRAAGASSPMASDLTETRLQQLDEFADSFALGGIGERVLAKRVKDLIREVRQLRAAKAPVAP